MRIWTAIDQDQGIFHATSAKELASHVGRSADRVRRVLSDNGRATINGFECFVEELSTYRRMRH